MLICSMVSRDNVLLLCCLLWLLLLVACVIDVMIVRACLMFRMCSVLLACVNVLCGCCFSCYI